MYRLRLFGGASIEDDAGTLEGPPAQRHRLALLALLAGHHPRPVARQRLMGLLWPKSGTGPARNLLNQAVHQLRKALGARTIRTVGDELVLDPGWLACDVLAFREALDAGELGRAAALHTGSFLAGLTLPNAAEFEHWVAQERARLDRELVAALEALATEETAAGDHRGAAALWRRCLELERYSGRAVLGLMRALAAAGNRAAALQEAEAHAVRLREELVAEPDAEVAALAERLRSGRPAPQGRDRIGWRRVPVPDASDGRATVAGEAPTPQTSGTTPARPMVGRRRERKRLQEAWLTATRRGTGFALIAGEAGIGKTRLAEELLDWAAKRGVVAASARSYAAEGRVAFGPVAEWLRSDALRESLQGLEASWRADLAPLVPELAGTGGRDAPPVPPEDWHRLRFFRALAGAVLGRGEPRLLLLDDLQWCDSDTLQWLHFLLRFDSGAPLLVLGTARLDEVAADHPLRALLADLRRDDRSALTQISLEPLSAEETASLGAAEAGRVLDDEERQRLFQETEGHPLFIVEGVRVGMLAAACGSEADGVASLPARVGTVIRARLARLTSPAREVAAVGATVGREFRPELVVAASRLAPETVADGLDELLERRIVRRGGAALDFTHDKLRAVVYSDLGPVRQRVLHGRVAEALEARGGHDVDALASTLGSHWEKAGDSAKAVALYRRAARQACTVHGYEEAAEYLQRALDLLDHLPAADPDERARLELALQGELGDSLLRTRGWAAPEVAAAHERERELAEALGDIEAVCRALWGLQSVLIVRSRAREAWAVGGRLLRLARARHDHVFMAAGHFTIGIASYLLGAFAAAAEHLGQGIAQHRVAPARDEDRSIRDHVGVLLSCVASQVAWHLGDVERALQHEREACVLAEELGSPFTRTAALVYGALLHQYRRDRARAEVRAARAIALGEEFGFPHYLHTARVVRGWAWAAEGRSREGSREIESALRAYAAIGSAIRRPYFLGLEARVHREGGRPDRALARVDRALELCEETGERWSEADLHRLRAELLRNLGADDDEVATCRRRAIRVAREQGAASLLERIERERLTEG